MADRSLIDLRRRLDAAMRHQEAALAELQAIRGEVAASMSAAAPSNGVGNTLVRLRATAIELGARISGDDRIGERDAARLLGIEPDTLGKQRQEGRAPPHYRAPIGGARISYKLSDLAAWLEGRRENF
jgi:hypothetical protein